MNKVKNSKRIDWPAIKQRMDNARILFERAATPDAEKTSYELQARAQALASTIPQNTAQEERIDILEFRLAHENYAIDTRLARVVTPLDHLTPIPCAPAFVLGIVNLQGEMLSVIDLKLFFDLPVSGLTDFHKIIVLEQQGMRVGILADSVIGVRTISTDLLQPSLPTLNGIREIYLRGVTPDRLILLDAAAILNSPDILVQDQAFV